jgi:DNA invertase Pin-like site-specific DNA recombinase
MITSPFPPGSRVVAYLRDSGHETQELSTTQQEEAIRTWCAEAGLLLVKIYADDAAPGSSAESRKQFLQMVDYFRSPNCTEAGIVVWSLSRFARQIDDSQFFKADLRRRGYVIHALNDDIPDTLDGRFFEAAVDWMSARYLEDLAHDIVRGQHHLVNAHGALGGTPPRGFKRQVITIGSRRDGKPHQVAKWVPDPETWEVCRLAWQMRAAGATYPEISAATHLYKSKNCWVDFFTNRLYLGELSFGGELIKNYCEPLIDQATWDTVQAIRADRSRSFHPGHGDPHHPRRAHSTFLLSGIAHCAICGCLLNGDSVSFRTTSKYHYYYYICNGASRKTCASRKIPQEALEKAVLTEVTTNILTPASMQAIISELTAQAAEQARQQAARRAALIKQISDLQRQIANLTELLADAGLTARSLLTKLQALEKEETLAQTALATLPTADTPDVSYLPNFPVRAHQLLEQLILASPEETRRILMSIISRVDVMRDGNLLRGHITFFADEIAAGASADGNFMPTGKCPRREPAYTHKIPLLVSLKK